MIDNPIEFLQLAQSLISSYDVYPYAKELHDSSEIEVYAAMHEFRLSSLVLYLIN